MKNKSCLLSLFLVSLCLVSCAFQSEWPEEYESYENAEWEEITRDQAIQIWSSYDKTMRDCSLTIWEKWMGTSPQKWTGGYIGGDTYESADGNIILLCIGNLTTDPANENDNAVFYRQKGNNSVIKIENSNGGAYNYAMNIYKDGWAVVKKNYDAENFTGYEFYYIKYNSILY